MLTASEEYSTKEGKHRDQTFGRAEEFAETSVAKMEKTIDNLEETLASTTEEDVEISPDHEPDCSETQ